MNTKQMTRLTIDDAIAWHVKQYNGCLEIANDAESRYGKETLTKAYEAARHHAASAAGLRNLVYETHRKNLNG